MSSRHHLKIYKPNLAKEASVLKPLLENTDEHITLDWKTDHTTSFYCILKIVSEITTKKNKHFDKNLETRVVCGGCTFVLSAALEQFAQEGWVALA